MTAEPTKRTRRTALERVLALLPQLKPEDLQALRLATIRKVTVHTASGTIQADLVALPAIEIGSFRLTGVRALVLGLPGNSGPGGRGLLGMNVLRRFQVKMDPDAGIMELTPRRSARSNNGRRRR